MISSAPDRNFPLLRRIILIRGGAVVIFFLSCLLTYISWDYIEKAIDARSERRFEQRAAYAVDAIEDRLIRYFSFLNSAGVVAAGAVEADEWTNYVRDAQFLRLNPRLAGLIFIEPIPRREAGRFEAQGRDDGFSEHRIRPPAAGDVSFPAKYVEPSGLELLGYDFGTNPTIERALNRASRDRRFVITDVTSVANIGEQVAFIWPVRKLSASGAYGSAGFVVALAPANLFLEDLTASPHSAYLTSEICEGETFEPSRVFLTAPAKSVGGDGPREYYGRIAVGGSTWTVKVHGSPKLLDGLERTAPSLVLAGGLIISVMVFSFAWRLGSGEIDATMLAKKIAGDLARSEELVAMILSNVPGSVYRCANDPEWTMEYISEGIERLTGYPATDFIGNRVRAYSSVIHSDDQGKIWSEVQTAIEKREPYILEYRIRTAAGRTKWVHELGRAITDDDGAVRHLDGVIFDVTELKTLEEQLFRAQRLEAVGQLAGGLAHDLGNILTILGFHTQRIRKLAGEEQGVGKSLDTLDRSIGRATDLTGKLLALGKPIELKRGSLDLNRVVARCVQDIRPLLPAHIALEVRLGSDLPDTFASQELLEQTILNLIINARDAMPDGGVLTLSTEKKELPEFFEHSHGSLRPGRYVVISVRDNGVGIPPEIYPNIFDPFFTTKGPEKGTGLGLSISRMIVREHGGDIVCMTTPGQGSEFQIFLPG